MTYEEDHGLEIFGQNLWMAAKQREKEDEGLKNDKLRLEYVMNDKNWVTVREMPGVRIRELSYKTESWYKLEIWQTYNGWDYTNHRKEEKTGWREVRMFTFNGDRHAFDEPISPAGIRDRIKEIDKEERKKK